MSTYVLDASALLRYLDREPGFDRVAGLLKRATRGGIGLLVSAVNWGEMASVLYQVHAEEAGRFKQDFKTPYADAFAGSLALREKATLVTADFDFKSAANTIKI